MDRLNRAALLGVLLASLLLTSVGAEAQTAYTLTVSTDMPSYTSGQTIKVSGTVSPAPGPSTAVFAKVINPAGKTVMVANAPVGATTGSYNFTLVAGGTGDWTTGTYKINATWGAYPPTRSTVATFGYTAPATTTTSTSSTTKTTSTSASTSSATKNSTSTSTSSSKTTTSSVTNTTSRTSVTSSLVSSSSTATSTTGGGGGGIPEFPYQVVFVGVFAAAIVGAYLLARRSATMIPGIRSPD